MGNLTNFPDRKIMLIGTVVFREHASEFVDMMIKAKSLLIEIAKRERTIVSRPDITRVASSWNCRNAVDGRGEASILPTITN